MSRGEIPLSATIYFSDFEHRRFFCRKFAFKHYGRTHYGSQPNRIGSLADASATLRASF